MTMDTIINILCTFMSFNTQTTGGPERICRPYSVIARQLLVSDEEHQRRASDIKYLRLVARPTGTSLLLLLSPLSWFLNLSLLAIASAVSDFAKMSCNSPVMSVLACDCSLLCESSSLLCCTVFLFHCSPRICPAFLWATIVVSKLVSWFQVGNLTPGNGLRMKTHHLGLFWHIYTNVHEYALRNQLTIII